MKKNLWLFLGFLLLVGFDQYTKYLAILHLNHTSGFDVLPGIFRLEYVENRGAAFGIFQGRQIFLLVITVIILLGLVFLLYKIPTERKYLPIQFVLLLLSSGAVGNMIDRTCRQFVVDFFYFCLIDFPVFNIADCYVVVGVILAIILIVFWYQEEDFSFLEKKQKTEEIDQ